MLFLCAYILLPPRIGSNPRSDLMDMPFRDPYSFRKLETLPRYQVEGWDKESKYWPKFHSKYPCRRPQLQVDCATREKSWGTRERRQLKWQCLDSSILLQRGDRMEFTSVAAATRLCFAHPRCEKLGREGRRILLTQARGGRHALCQRRCLCVVCRESFH